jgi:hypothetical protein
MNRLWLSLCIAAAVAFMASTGVRAEGRSPARAAAQPAGAALTPARPDAGAQPSRKGRDGAACSSDDECEHVCEGGSCCTAHDETCDASSHCCGHQSCTNGSCP